MHELGKATEAVAGICCIHVDAVAFAGVLARGVGAGLTLCSRARPPEPSTHARLDPHRRRLLPLGDRGLTATEQMPLGDGDGEVFFEGGGDDREGLLRANATHRRAAREAEV